MNRTETLSRAELREKRLDELLQRCQEQMLAQIIGPFGLTLAMFDDKDGGNVTTRHNFEQGIVATETDQQRYDAWKDTKDGNYNRKYYDAELPKKRKELFKSDDPITSVYTGRELERDGRTHLEHVTAAKTIETDSRANLFMSQEERVRMANQDANLKPLEVSINRSLGDRDKAEWAGKQRKKDPGKTNAESFGVDKDLMAQAVAESQRAIKKDLLVAQIKKQGAELTVTGAKDAGRNALRHALGVLLHEGVTGLISELKQVMRQKNHENLVDDLIGAIKRVFERVVSRFRHALQAALGGGVQGFISNLLTFLINSLVTTSAKIVTVIREGMKGLWEAAKMLVNPPEHLSALEVSRQVTKIIAAVVTTSLGMIFEESLKTALLTMAPILAPLIDVLSPVVAAILTGIGTALIIYTLDRFFDWLSSTGTELLQAFEANLDAMQKNVETMLQWVSSQYQNSQKYQAISNGYLLIECYLDETLEHQQITLEHGQYMLSQQQNFNQQLGQTISNTIQAEQDVMALLEVHQLENKQEWN